MMKRLFSASMVFAACVSLHGATLMWDANQPVEYHTNGTEISSNVLSGYKVYQGNASRSYQTNFTTTNTFWRITNLFAGTNFFSVTAVDTEGLESEYSDEVFLARTNRPATPRNLRFSAVLNVQSAPAVNGPWSQEPELGEVDLTPQSRFFRLALHPIEPASLLRPLRLEPTAGSKRGKWPLTIPARPRQLPPFPPG